MLYSSHYIALFSLTLLLKGVSSVPNKCVPKSQYVSSTAPAISSTPVTTQTNSASPAATTLLTTISVVTSSTSTPKYTLDKDVILPTVLISSTPGVIIEPTSPPQSTAVPTNSYLSSSTPDIIIEPTSSPQTTAAPTSSYFSSSTPGIIIEPTSPPQTTAVPTSSYSSSSPPGIIIEPTSPPQSTVTTTSSIEVVPSSTQGPIVDPKEGNVDFYNFQAGSSLGDLVVEYCPQNAVISNNQLDMILSPQCGTNIVYNKPMKTGKVEASLRMAPGSGAVTALSFFGANLDEIDVEFVGRDPITWQSMYFVRGLAVDKLAGFHSASDGTPLDSNFHTYGVELLDNAINWYFDGNIVRTLQKTSDATFPSQAGDSVKFGVWNGGAVSPDWAGYTDFSTGNKVASMKWIKFTHYN
ncbi:Extracellular glycosidase CRH11 [Smittium mucronatum]|uniref:Extracellular glycosidase CRH11 n=1 Tax=Smittium mucronatum TaxID=133383 RepID=A0A1R0GQN8_9FUNG|nr:Extracellular glycosidase CRH11 [Smittium mucronatum]